MRKIYIALLIAIVCGGCTSRRQTDGEPLYVSILPLRSLVQGIVGDCLLYTSPSPRDCS